MTLRLHLWRVPVHLDGVDGHLYVAAPTRFRARLEAALLLLDAVLVAALRLGHPLSHPHVAAGEPTDLGPGVEDACDQDRSAG